MQAGALMLHGPGRGCVLPVSGIAVTLAMPTGAEELLLAEARPDDPRLALALVQSLARAVPAPDWAGLSVTDIDTIILRLRQMVVGEQISASLLCQAEGCGSRIEISFRIEDYLAHHKPVARPRGRGWPAALPRGRGWEVSPPDADGWYGLQTDSVLQARFRLPVLADQIEAGLRADAAEWLARQCIAPVKLPARVRARVEAAMAAMAPPLSGTLQGACPECGAAVAPLFQARIYCLRELSDQARFIYDDVDVLAGRYHWPEREILGLPYARRVQYAERARQGGYVS
jgi:hypothetical protein